MFENYDKTTGIHYGCISMNSLCMETIEEWLENDRVYDAAKKELDQALAVLMNLGILDSDEYDAKLQEFNDHWSTDDPEYYYEGNGYKVEYSPSLFCWIILKSPYYTYTRPCSPCVPNAGDLDTPLELSPSDHILNLEIHNIGKTYCLPIEYFDPDYHPIPYIHYYNVSDDMGVE